jgi:hypothetical protein
MPHQTTTQEPADWMRRLRFLQKYDVGPTTFARWKKEGLIETRTIGGMTFVRDRLPEPNSANPK